MVKKEQLTIAQDLLDEIGEHTEYKLRYVVEYINEWLRVTSNYKNTRNINFIDCMCNAGIYRNDILGTPTQIMNLFVEYAIKFPNIKYNIFLNDIDTERIKAIYNVLDKYTDYRQYSNINLFISNKDVNDYIQELINKEMFFNMNAQAFTVLFVDPYRFGDVQIKKLNYFLNKYKSELIYNFFESDYRRNIKNVSAQAKIEMMSKSTEGIEEYKSGMNADELLIALQKNFINKTNLKYTFAYPFHIKNNAKLYYIIYGTPHIEGMRKIKITLWNVFNGNAKFRVSKDKEQITFFTQEIEKEVNVQMYIGKAKDSLINKFYGQSVEFRIIEEYILLYTMINSLQIIEGVLKPLINDKKIIKENINGKSNYKNDIYTFID